MAFILVVDDESDIRELIKDILLDDGHEVAVAENAAAARQQKRNHAFDLILLDIWMPDEDGISILKEWSMRGGLPCPIIVISGHGTIETAVEATKLGAYDFIEKPISLAKLMLTVNRALETGKLRSENEGLRRQMPPPPPEPIGKSRLMQSVKANLERAAQTDAPVLLEGELGTGKETLARWLHQQSARRGNPFVKVSVSNLPKQEAGKVIFGHQDHEGFHPGLIDQAKHGVLYLDGVTDLDADLQKELAGALEAQSYLRAGSSAAQPLQVRLIAASHQALEPLVREDAFDRGLFYQLNVLLISVPPLRERIDDLGELLEFFSDFFSTRDGLPYRPFSSGAQNRLRQYTWPGNLREMRNLVQRLHILGDGGNIEPHEIELVLNHRLAPQARKSADEDFPIDLSVPLRQARDVFEKTYLTQLLKKSGGSVGKLAHLSGMERTHLYRKLKDLGIDIRQEKNDT